jgi:hydrogenase maturation protease
MGNLLLEDEGLGIHALNILLQRFELPAEVECLDGGTSGMALIDDIGGREHVLVLDAVQTGAPPGTLVSLRGGEVPVYFGVKVTPHQLGLSDVLAHLELTGERPGSVSVLGLVPVSMEMSLQPSEQITGRLNSLVEAAVEELSAMGYALRPRVESGAGQ